MSTSVYLGMLKRAPPRVNAAWWALAQTALVFSWRAHGARMTAFELGHTFTI